MKPIDKTLVNTLAQDLMLELQEQEVIEILEENNTFTTMLSLLNEIDTQDVVAMHYPFETVQTFLREDVPSKTITQDEVFKNAPHVEGDYIEVVKVVK